MFLVFVCSASRSRFVVVIERIVSLSPYTIDVPIASGVLPARSHTTAALICQPQIIQDIVN